MNGKEGRNDGNKEGREEEKEQRKGGEGHYRKMSSLRNVYYKHAVHIFAHIPQ